MAGIFCILLVSLLSPLLAKGELLLVEDVEEKVQDWPEPAQELWRELPEGAITPEVIFERALRSSDQIDIIKAQRLLRLADELEPQSLVGTSLEGELSFSDSRNQPVSFFGPERAWQRRGEVRLIQGLATGTTVSLGLAQDSSHQRFPSLPGPLSFPNIDYDEARYFVRLRQSLWRNFFGQDTRNLLLAGEKLGKAGNYELLQSTEEFLSDLYQTFLTAWSLQAEMISISESQARTRRLERITQSKIRLGTAESPDLLQIRGSLNQLAIRKLQVEQQLRDIWTQLIVSLKLPPELMEVPIDEVPLLLDESLNEAQKLCQETSLEERPPQSEIVALRLEYEASRLQTEALESHSQPDVSAFLNHTNNQVDSSLGTAWNNVLNGNHPGTTVGLQVVVPLSATEATTRYLRSKAQTETLRARLSYAEANLKSDWDVLCRELKVQMSSLDLWSENLDLEGRRQRQENRRFELGRSTANMAVRSELDVVQSDLNYRRSMVEARRTAWQIRVQSGNISSYLSEWIRKGE